MNEEIAASLQSLRESIAKLTRIPLLLVVEDDVHDSELLVYQLNQYFKRCEIMTCNSGEAALDILENNRIDAVFLDLKLPGISGLDVLRRINAEKKVVLIIVTGLNGESEVTLEAIRLGAVKVIAKPVSQEDLKKTFETI